MKLKVLLALTLLYAGSTMIGYIGFGVGYGAGYGPGWGYPYGAYYAYPYGWGYGAWGPSFGYYGAPETPEQSERRDNADQRRQIARQIDDSYRQISRKRKTNRSNIQ